MVTYSGLLLFLVQLKSDSKNLEDTKYQIQACLDFLKKWEQKHKQVAGFFRKDRSNKILRDITLAIYRARLDIAGKLNSAKNKCDLCGNTC